ncbi:hypothetical protein TNCV_5032261 [Trichonephila clavipes]|nr:hypothetical protein TNCV_5032261 [Trichonephila clavipes]
MLASQSMERKKEQASPEKLRAGAFKADRITAERIRCEFITVPIYHSDLPNGLTIHGRCKIKIVSQGPGRLPSILRYQKQRRVYFRVD